MKEKVCTIQLTHCQFGYARVWHGSHMSELSKHTLSQISAYEHTSRLVPSTGKSRELSANNCKEIKETLSTDCSQSPQNGVYWVQNQQVCM